MDKNKLKRSLGLKEGITLTTGCVVGVGIFTVGSNTVGIMGSGVILCTLIALLICVMPAMMYGEMGAALPYAGGTYQYAKRAINRPIASIAAWQYMVAVIATVAGESLAFSNYLSYIFKAAGAQTTPDSRILAIILMAFFIFINVRGVKVSGRVQNGFMAFFWAASLIWLIYMAHNLDLSHYLPSAMVAIPGIRDWLMCIVYIWWCFAGFETAVGMGGEIRFPQINIPRILILSPFLVFAINAIFQFFLVGLVPTEMLSALAEAEAPYAEGLTIAGFVGFPLVFLCIAITFGGDLSTMNPGVAGPARYMFEMGTDNVFPPVLGRVHKKWKTPYVAVIVVGIVALVLILTGSITIIAEVSVASVFWCYIIGFISFIALRIKEPDLKRPYKAKAGIPGAVISIALYIVMVCAVGLYYFLLSLCIVAVCLIVYFLYSRTHVPDAATAQAEWDKESAAYEEDIPTPEEKKKLDREFRIWRTVIIVILAIVAVVWIAAFAIQ